MDVTIHTMRVNKLRFRSAQKMCNKVQKRKRPCKRMIFQTYNHQRPLRGWNILMRPPHTDFHCGQSKCCQQKSNQTHVPCDNTPRLLFICLTFNAPFCLCGWICNVDNEHVRAVLPCLCHCIVCTILAQEQKNGLNNKKSLIKGYRKLWTCAKLTHLISDNWRNLVFVFYSTAWYFWGGFWDLLGQNFFL